MKKHTSRTALRLPIEQRQEIEKLIRKGKFKNISQVIRLALTEFLDKASS
jgi:Arc/MetJ-type ribon-helix-helix transcriptional regulator